MCETEVDDALKSFWSVTQGCRLILIVLGFASARQIFLTQKTCGFSITFLYLWAMSLAFKYLGDHSESQLEVPMKFVEWREIAYSFQILLLLVTVCQLFLCPRCTEYLDDAADVLWINVSIIASLILATDDMSIYLTAKERWIFGSYLEIAALISKLMFIKKYFTLLNRFSIWKYYADNMLFCDLGNLTCYNYDYYQHKLYGNIGYKFTYLKLLVWLSFFISCILKSRDEVREIVARENAPIELVRTASESTPAETTLDMPVVRHVLGEMYAIENKHGLMSPN